MGIFHLLLIWLYCLVQSAMAMSQKQESLSGHILANYLSTNGSNTLSNTLSLSLFSLCFWAP